MWKHWNRLSSRRWFSQRHSIDIPAFKVALVGRTNVGKSTLFNRLTKSRNAIVHDVPGTTRDRRESLGYLAGMKLSILDTGGLADAPVGSLEEGMLFQTQQALLDANLIFFMIDGRTGVTPIDKYFMKWLRKQKTQVPMHLLANKLEGYPDQWEDEMYSFYELGMGPAIPISAEHGEGMAFLVDAIAPHYEPYEEEQLKQLEVAEVEETEERKEPIKLAIVGRPNVGKSTLLNQMIRKERVLTGSMPGVTRDAVEVEWEFSNRKVKLVDTAGIRRAGKRDHSNQIENLSVRDANRAIASAQVVAIVVDLHEDKLINMDLAIAEKAVQDGRAVVFVANKADLVTNAQFENHRLKDDLSSSFAQLRGVPVVPVSAKTGFGVRRIMPEVLSAFEKWNVRISTGRLNRFLMALHRHHPPPSTKGKQLKVKYMTQVSIRPPVFCMFVNQSKLVSESYQRFLLNQLREEFELIGCPVRLLIRTTTNPYQDKGKQKPKPMYSS